MFTAFGLGAVPIAAQIGSNNGKMPGQRRRYFSPGHMRLRMAVEQKQRRPLPASGGPYGKPVRKLYISQPEPFEEG
ncbi:hypothetical protein Aam_022_022 [Acidocella aminolytica 101 = DSM 11237]|uniref:Uncharacterized protein n=1 Tax=Acidocella aminolytica 101 = DSM 11237 TaxID=1120923 RepID=A0A0D6PCN5_9PROT|nr:hypothetical protein Aam_022_022 [Acidocella aminolytica 101 = DSM 11237]